jgi:AraC-like DNA-binding protein
MREWAYIHSELEWIYDHEVPETYRDRVVNKEAGGYWAWYIREGRVVVVTTGGRRYEAGSGILSLHFRCEWPSGENILSGNGGLVFAGETYPALERRATQLERMVRRHLPDADRNYFSCFSDYERFLSFHTLFQQWLIIWFKIQKENGADVSRLLAADDRTLRALRCLNRAPLREGLPHEALRKESGLGEAHLNRLFLEQYGMTVRKCWEQRRLKAAKTHLETSMMPVKEVAYTLGFRSDSHFMMWFKQHTGKRPKEYRKLHRLIDS